MHSFDITMDNISKIEGHAKLYVKVKNKKVENVKFSITENKRFFEEAARGKNFKAAPQLMSRICGTCSIAHLMCCIEAIEKALEVKPSHQTILLKKLATYGLMIRDHALHLYLFSLPDVFNKDSILEFSEDNEVEHELLHDAFAVKKAGNDLCVLVAGKAVHAPYPTIGGFAKVPTNEEAKKVVESLKAIRPKVMRLIDVYYNWNERLERNSNFVALATEDFSFLIGKIKSSSGLCVEEKDYNKHLHKVVIPYSTATGYDFEGGDFFVGALARLNLGKNALHKNTKRDAKKYLNRFPSNNVFDNNLAQAIEILHSIDHSIEILTNHKFEPENLPQIKPKEGTGIGVIEAPRGTLYYKVSLNENGIIDRATVIVPTQQNQISIEKDIKNIVQEMIDEDKEKIQYKIEKLVRAYDPCMSCASHFLKIKWVEQNKKK
jgi:coenzyme F420-reducing hydrogenase alpha subunit